VSAILVTQCVQNDFVRSLAPGEPLPNLVHVGRLEAERLCGSAGALVGFLEQAHGVEPERLAIVHVVDEHDPVRHAAHLERFRPHCLAGSDGARLVEPVGELARLRPRTFHVTAGDLNDFEDSSLEETLDALAPPGERGEVRVGVVGVWTDVKVAMLLYDLRTRWRAAHLSTCTALTASRSIAAHFRALESLGEVLGVEVHDSPGRFLEWLVPGRAVPAVPPAKAALRIEPPCGVPSFWTDEHVAERDALAGGFADGQAELALAPLGGGFSGAQVFIARRPGHNASVVKVGARDEIAGERFGNERVARVLGDVVPTLHRWREGRHLAAMELELAESADPAASAPATFQRLDRDDDGEPTTARLERTLEAALGWALGRLYRGAEKDNADLLSSYGFTDGRGGVPFGASVIAKADAVARESGFGHARELLESARPDEPWLEPRAFYEEWLPGRALTREVYPSLVHADLNLANILVSFREGEEEPARLWLIDFARLARLPCLTDFAKVENDLSYILLPCAAADAQARLQAMQEARLTAATLEVDVSALAQTAREMRYARLLRALRATAARIDPRGAEAMADYRVALLRYAAHTLGFDEPSPRQRALALVACARLAGAIAG
jgi:nicotinamidase-related amidase